ncbi:MAG TPA: hypothetical protein VE571_14140 [Solirubrobacteraceae bacterium]|nr:hypothetical protein [Solirubrobacteraceae bacterium]
MSEVSKRCWPTASAPRCCCATRRRGPTCIPAFPPSTPTGATSSSPGIAPACSSTSPTTWPSWPCGGPDALALLSHLGVNTFNNFAVDKAKQFVPCTPDGYVIGDVILFHLADDEFNMVGRAPCSTG